VKHEEEGGFVRAMKSGPQKILYVRRDVEESVVIPRTLVQYKAGGSYIAGEAVRKTFKL